MNERKKEQHFHRRPIIEEVPEEKGITIAESLALFLKLRRSGGLEASEDLRKSEYGFGRYRISVRTRDAIQEMLRVRRRKCLVKPTANNDAPVFRSPFSAGYYE